MAGDSGRREYGMYAMQHCAGNLEYMCMTCIVSHGNEVIDIYF